MARRTKLQRERPRPVVASAQPYPRPNMWFYLLCVVLVAATLAVYGPVTHFPLINTDDRDYVTNNAVVKAGLTTEGIKWAFTTYAAGNWHPLTWLSHMLDSTWTGPSGTELPQVGKRHLTSLLLHAANTLLLFLLLLRLTGHVWRSAFVAAVFALHPLHVESVAWIAERKDVLSTLFWLLATLTYVSYTRAVQAVDSQVAISPRDSRRARRSGRGSRTGHWRAGIYYLLTLLLLALGLLAKPMLVTLPLILLILDFWPLKRLRAGALWLPVAEKLPMLLLAVISSVVTLTAQGSVKAVTSLTALSLAQRLQNSAMSYAIYACKMFWPTRLAAYYPHPRLGWPAYEVGAAVAALLLVSWLAVRWARSRPYFTVGWLWYVVTLIPVIGIVQVGGQARADRYTYIPLIGISLIVAYAIPELLARVRLSGRTGLYVQGAVAVLALAALSGLTSRQVGYWRDGIAIARHSIAVTSDNWFEEQSLGSQLEDEAEQLTRLGKVDEGLSIAGQAEVHLRKSLSRADDCADAHNDLGRALMLKGDMDGAVYEFGRAIELNPSHALAYNNLGNAYLRLNQLDKAIESYKQTLELDPLNMYATYNMALALQAQNRPDEATEQFLSALRLQPNTYVAYWARHNAAVLLQRKGDIQTAVQLEREAVQVNQQTNVDPSNAAAVLLKSLGG